MCARLRVRELRWMHAGLISWAVETQSDADTIVALPPKRDSDLLSCAAQKEEQQPSWLSAPRSAAAAPLIDGGELSFLALGLFSLAVLAPAPDRLGAASHRDEPNNQLDDLHAATQSREPEWIAGCSTAPSQKCQSPL